MPRTSRQTFEETLLAVTPRNAQSLENKAHTASSLAVTYPENADAFRTIESEAIQQLFRILAYVPWIGNPSAIVGSEPDRVLNLARLAAD